MSNIKIAESDKLDTSNYHVWALKTQCMLRAHDMWDPVEAKLPPTEAAAIKADKKALAVIGLAVKDHHLTKIMKCKTSKEAWDMLKAAYEAVSMARQQILQQQLYTLKMGTDETLSKYVARAEQYTGQLTAAGAEITEAGAVGWMLRGLPSSYDMTVTALAAAGSEQTFSNMFAKLLPVEQKAELEAAVANDTAAYYVGRSGRGPSYPPKNNQFAGSSKICHYCNKPGHIKAECRKMARDLGHGDQKQPTSSGFGAFSSGMRGRGGSSRRPPRLHEEPVVLSAFSTSSGDNTRTWLLDSGSAHHITNDLASLHNKRQLVNQIAVTCANGEKTYVSTVGDISFDTILEDNQLSYITLRDVYHIPSAPANLLSVSSAVDHGARLTVSGGSARLSLWDGTPLIDAYEQHGVYMFPADLRVPVEQASSRATAPMAASALTSSSGDSSASDMLVWHRRFAHLGNANLTKLAKSNMVTGLHIKDFTTTPVCEPCVLSKQHRHPFGTSESKTTRPMQLVHMDVMGPMPVESYGGSRYVATYQDDYTGFSIVEPLKAKAAVPLKTFEVLQHMQVHSGHKLCTVRSDNGGEYVNHKLANYFKANGVEHNLTVPYTPQQNGKAERLNRTLLDRTRSMLIESGAPKNLWAEALSTANYIRNLSPYKGGEQVPYELFYGNKPDVSHLRVFGSKAYALLPPHKRQDKLSARSLLGTFVGYPRGTKGYRIFVGGKIIISRDVTFDESSYSGSSMTADINAGEPLFYPDTEVAIKRSETTPTSPPPAEQPARQPLQYNGRSFSQSPTPAGSDDGTADGGGDIHTDGATAPQAEEPQALRYPMRERHAPTTYEPTFAVITVLPKVPTTYEEAMRSPEAAQWQAAMDEEMSSVYGNNTWTLQDLPPGAKAIPLKWVYTLKRNADGSIERYKARIVAKGFMQRESVDYGEIFAPVGKYSTLRALLARTAAQGLVLHQLDIKTAFLNGKLEEEIYVQQPQGYESGDGSLACRLHRSLYGLRQAPRTWYIRLTEELQAIGFTPSAADPSLFISAGKASNTYALVYVDDILMAGPDLAAVNGVKQQLMTTFEARDLGEAHYFLGMTITHRSDGTIKLAQEKMINEIITTYGMTEGKTKSTPLNATVPLTADGGTPLDTSEFHYSGLVGSLLYLSTCTRPDIAQAVGVLAKYMAAPTTSHWQAAKGVVRYLAGTSDYGIIYGGKTGISGYCDADYAGDLDTRRSTTGYVFIMNGGAVSWSSKRQPTVAASTTEAEYMAAAQAVKEALWLRTLLIDLRLGIQPITIFADNQSAIKLLKNPISSQRSKHIDVIYHFARERLARGEVCFKYIKTDDMIADSLTKAVPAHKTESCRRGMGMG